MIISVERRARLWSFTAGRLKAHAVRLMAASTRVFEIATKAQRRANDLRAQDIELRRKVNP